MKTETEVRNQQAINDFFRGFGTDTAKEYSKSFIDLAAMVAEKQNLTDNYREDLISKIRDLNTLILQLGEMAEVSPPILQRLYQKN